MKKRLLLIGIALIVGVAIFGCGSENKTNTESSLKKTYKNIEKEKSIHRTIRAAYDKERDHLEIAFYPGAKIDKLFDILNKNIKGTSTGELYFENDKWCCRKGDLPGPKSGSLSNTQKWIVLGDILLTNEETLLGRGT